MNIYEEIYCDELNDQIKLYSELCDLTDRQIRDFEKIRKLDSSQFPPIVANLLREGKPLLAKLEDVFKQINYHMKWG